LARIWSFYKVSWVDYNPEKIAGPTESGYTGSELDPRSTVAQMSGNPANQALRFADALFSILLAFRMSKRRALQWG
jgi:hypothetical protein